MEPRLRITGLVATERTMTTGDLAAMPSAAAEVAGIVGHAVAVRDLADAVGPAPDATHCTVVSSDGYRASVPLADLLAGGWIAFSLDDGPLPPERGGPLRLTVIDGTTLCWNVKDVAELRFAPEQEPDDVPENPPH